jgi:hypothetical protein
MSIENEPRIPAGQPGGGQWTGGSLTIEAKPIGKYKPLAVVQNPEEAKKWIDEHAKWVYGGTAGKFEVAQHPSGAEIIITQPRPSSHVAADIEQFGSGGASKEASVSYNLTHRDVPGRQDRRD